MMKYFTIIALFAMAFTTVSAQHRPLPDIKLYNGTDVGRVVCFHHSQYTPANIVPVGFLDIEGEYVDGLFQPTGYEGQDISKIQYFKDLCDDNLPKCQGQCWAGGDRKINYADIE